MIITRKKAQEETVGFVVIILLVSIVALVFLGIALRKGSPVEDSVRLENFVQSALEYTTRCSKNSEFEYQNLAGIIRGCHNGLVCSDERDFCEVLNETMEDMIETSFRIDGNSPITYYLLDVYYRENMTNVEDIEVIYTLEKGLCEGTRSGAEQVISDLPGNIQVEFQTCTKT